MNHVIVVPPLPLVAPAPPTRLLRMVPLELIWQRPETHLPTLVVYRDGSVGNAPRRVIKP
jgi:hypothetical protein